VHLFSRVPVFCLDVLLLHHIRRRRIVDVCDVDEALTVNPYVMRMRKDLCVFGDLGSEDAGDES